MEEIKLLWNAFMKIKFPRGEDAGDLHVDLAEADTFASGCISTFIAKGKLDEHGIRTLKKCVGKLLTLHAQFNVNQLEHKQYAFRLLFLSEKVLAACESQS